MVMFPIGAFSQLSRVSKRLLQYYDEIGLFKPAHLDPETGYRYYSAKQLPHLNRILALKDLGFSLETIAGMLQADVSDEAIHGMLLLKKAEVEQTVLEELQRLRRIEARLQQNQRSEETLVVVVKSIPAQLFLSIRTLPPSAEDLFQLVQLVQRVLPSRVEPRILGLFLAPLLRLQMSRVGARSIEELKYYVERDQVHPRKLKAQRKRGRKPLR